MNCRILTILFFVFIVFTSKSWAWSTKDNFDKNKNYYTGSGRFSGKTCSECHAGTTDKDIFYLSGISYSKEQKAFYYTPSEVYTLAVTMLSNSQTDLYKKQNGFVLEILDSSGEPAGKLASESTTQLSGDPSGVVLDGDNPAEIAREWTFKWTSPASGSGSLIIYIAGVDGNGDESEGAEDITDAGLINLIEQPVTASPGKGGCGISTIFPWSGFWGLVVAFALAFLLLGLIFLASRSRVQGNQP